MSSDDKKPKCYLSFDVEADGPAPGLNSMLSFGMVGLLESGEEIFSFEANLKTLDGAVASPKTMEWWSKPEQKESWDYARSNQQDPAQVFDDLNSKIAVLKTKYSLRPVAWPSAYDWQWINYYFHKFIGANPLGYTALCISSWAKAKGKKLSFSLNHRAIDDARAQGKAFIAMLNEQRKD